MKPPTLTIERLLAAAEMDSSGCLLFTKNLDRQGYARIWHAGDKEKRLVHRVAYELFVGPIPAGYQVDHLCGVRNCINPFHLEAVTPLVNTRRAARGNAAKTMCIHGHEFTTTNTRIVTRPDGSKVRACRRCDADRQATYRERRAA